MTYHILQLTAPWSQTRCKHCIEKHCGTILQTTFFQTIKCNRFVICLSPLAAPTSQQILLMKLCLSLCPFNTCSWQSMMSISYFFCSAVFSPYIPAWTPILLPLHRAISGYISPESPGTYSNVQTVELNCSSFITAEVKT